MKVVPGIYKPLPADHGELCHPVQADGFHLLTELCNENSRAGTWVPPAMEVIDADEGKPLRRTDAPWCSSSSMVFRSTVLDKLGDLLTAAGKVLPLACPGHELYVLNVTRVIPALNEDASDVWRFDGGQIAWIRRHEFFPDRVVDVDVFKLTCLRVSPVYFSHRFVERWRRSRLTGLTFTLEWAYPAALSR